MSELRIPVDEDLKLKIITLKQFFKIRKSTELIRTLITLKYQEIKKLQMQFTEKKESIAEE